MRNLTRKQKSLLTEWFKKHKEEVGLFFSIENCQSFTLEFLEELEAINNSEVLIVNINNFISELAMKP